MADKVKTTALTKKLDISPPTINRLIKKDKLFAKPIKIGRENYFDLDEVNKWLESRATNQKAIKSDDKIISGARFLELTGRSKGWLWLNVIKPKALTRINLSPDPKSNKLVNFFIEREVYEMFGDLIEVTKGGAA